MVTEQLHKFSIMALQTDKVAILDWLHARGIVHVDQGTSQLGTDNAIPNLVNIAELLLEMRWLAEHLKVDLGLCEFSNLSLSEIVEDGKNLMKYHPKIKSLIDTRNALEKEEAQLRAEKIILDSIGEDLTGLQDTEHTFLRVIEGELSSTKHLTLIPGKTHSLVQGLKEDYEKLKLQPVRILELPEYRSLKVLEKRLTNIHKERKKILKELEYIGAQEGKHITQVHHDLTIYHDRYAVTARTQGTQDIFLLQGFVSNRDREKLLDINEEFTVHLEYEQAKEGPSKLKNLPYIKHFQFLTRMYGVPEYRRVDPTFPVAIFLPIFFGFMFSDIGYGLMLMLCSIFLLKKATKTTKIMHDGGIVLLVCGITTTIFGILFGSFFGNLIPITPLLFNPFEEAMMILVMALGIGLLHLNLGIIILAVESLRKKDYRAFVLQVLSVLLLQVGAGLFLVNTNAAFITLGVAVILLIKKSSLMGLMDVTGFAGAWFSYARLLALGLATGGIALGINIIGQQVFGLGPAGAILAGIIVGVGHLFNFLLNVLGSSIHSVRLHYVEFFSQFYEAGGRGFEAYTTERTIDEV